MDMQVLEKVTNAHTKRTQPHKDTWGLKELKMEMYVTALTEAEENVAISRQLARETWDQGDFSAHWVWVDFACEWTAWLLKLQAATVAEYYDWYTRTQLGLVF